MSISGRMTLCNMAVEMGAKNGIIAPDETTAEYLADKIKKMPDIKRTKKRQRRRIRAHSRIRRLQTWNPKLHAPHQLTTLNQSAKSATSQLTKPSSDQLHQRQIRRPALAAKVMKGKKVKDGVRALVIPASQEI